MNDYNLQKSGRARSSSKEALQAWFKDRKGFDGGIAVQDGPNGWKINHNAKYSHDSSLKYWDVLDLG